MSDTFGRLFDGLRYGRSGVGSVQPRVMKTGSRRQRAATRKREAGRQTLHQELLEPRLAMAVEIFDFPRGVDRWVGEGANTDEDQAVFQAVLGRAVITTDQADDVFVKQVASVSQDLLVSSNSSFLGYQTIDAIDAYDSLFITNGTIRRDGRVLPDVTNGTVSTFVLTDYNAFVDDDPLGQFPFNQSFPFESQILYRQSDGTESRWTLTNYTTIVDGPGYGQQAMLPGYIKPLSIDFERAEELKFGLSKSAASVTWVDAFEKSTELVERPKFVAGLGTNAPIYTAGFGIAGANEVTLTYRLPSAMAALAEGGANQRSLGIVPATLRGTLDTDYGLISYFADEQGTLRFGNGDSKTFFDRNETGRSNGLGISPRFSDKSGEGVIEVRGTIVGTQLVFTFRNWYRVSSGSVYSFDGPGIFLHAVEGSLEVSATYSTYSQDPTPNEVTMVAGQDFTRELTVDLLTPGSTFNADTTLEIASDVRSSKRDAGDYDLRATNVNINAPIAAKGGLRTVNTASVFTPGTVFAGRSQSTDRSRVSLQGPFIDSPTLVLWDQPTQPASAIAEVNSNGTVKQLTVLPGSEGYGYDRDNPPVVTVASPESATAAAVTVRINGSVDRVSVLTKGDQYANGATVTLSQPEAGFVSRDPRRVVLNSGGANYISAPTVLLYGGGGTGATATAIFDDATKTVTGITITNSGINYTQPPTVYFYGGEGPATQAARATVFLEYDTARAEASVVNGRVEDIVVTNAGSGSTAAPTILIHGLPPATGGAAAGAGATAQATIAGGAVQVQVTSAGVGYAPGQPVTATIRGTGFDQDGVVQFQVNGQGQVRDDEVLSIEVLDGGFGYLDAQPPTVTITGGDGNATARAVVVNGQLRRIIVTNSGSGYRSAPIIGIDSRQTPGSRAAVAVATISQPVIVLPGRFQSTAGARVVMPAPSALTTAFTQATARWDGRGLVISEPGSGYKGKTANSPSEVVNVYVWGGGASYTSLLADPYRDLPGIHGYYGRAEVGPNGTITSITRDPMKPATDDIFSSNPTVYIEPPDQVAAFLAVVDDTGRVNSFVELQKGLSYVARPEVEITLPQAIKAATAGAAIDAVTGGVTGISVIDKGYGYVAPPRVVIAPPDEGLGAEQARAEAVIDSEGRVIEIIVIDPGSGYRSRPIVELAAVNPRATVESLNVNAAVEANIYEMYVGDDFGTELERGRLFVSPTGGLSAQRLEFEGDTATAATKILTFTGAQRANVIANASVFGIGIPDGTRITRVVYNTATLQTVATVTPGALALFSGTSVELGGGAASSYIEAHAADVYVESRIEALNQSYLFNSFMPDGQLAPFVFTTRSPNTGNDTGTIIGSVVNVTMGNRMPTPLFGATAFSIVDISTELNSLRIRAGEDVANPAGAFPYQVDIREKDNLRIAAVAASSMPISIRAGGSIAMPAGLSTASDLTIVARNDDDRSQFTTFTVQAPITSDYGQIFILADTVSVRNSLEVKAAAVTTDRQDIVLVAERGDMELVGRVSAVNDVSLEQRNRDETTIGRIFGASRVRGKYLSVRSEGAVEIGTEAERLDGRAVTGFVLTEVDDITISSLVSGGLVSLTANGVDPGKQSDTDVVPNDIALRAYLTEVNQLEVSTPSGSNQVFVDTVRPVALGNPTAIAVGRSMLTAGTAEIRTTGADVTVLDAPIGGTSGRYVRTATDRSLAAATGAAVTYNPGVPGTVAATLSGAGRLPAIGGVSLGVGDRVLVKDQVTAGVLGVRQNRENGIYQVTMVGGGVLGSTRWELRRAADADTVADMPSNTYARVGEGVFTGKHFQLTYVSSPTTLVERTGTNQLQLPVGFPYASRFSVGQLVTGTGIAPGARIAEISTLSDGSKIVRLAKVTAPVSAPTGNVLTLGPSFSGFQNLTVGQRVFGPGVLPGTLITAIDASGRKVSVSPGGMPYSGPAIPADLISTTPSPFHDEGFDEYADLNPAFNDFDLIHVGQVVTGPGLVGNAIVTGVDPAFRRLGFKSGSINPAYNNLGTLLTFSRVTQVQFGMAQGFGSGYATFDVSPLGTTQVSVKEIQVFTRIGAEANGTNVDLVVTSNGVTNSSPSSLGKMLLLRQTNDAKSISGVDQPMSFAFRTLPGPIRLEQELPVIKRPFAIIGNSSVVVDGSRIVKTRTDANVTGNQTVNGFEFGAESGARGSVPGASISSLTVGGFYKGDGIFVRDAKDILVDRVVLGRGRSSAGGVVPNSNAGGVHVSGAGSATVVSSQIVSTKQYRDSVTGQLLGGQGVRTTGAGSVTVVGSTIGLANEGNHVGIELSGAGMSRIGVEPVVVRSEGRVSGGSNQLTLPSGVKAESVYVGQPVIGTGIPSGAVITAIDGNTLTLSRTMTFTGSVAIAFGSAGRNTIQSNRDGIRLISGMSTVIHSDIRSNVFSGILLEGGVHTIGSGSKTRTAAGLNLPSANVISANGSWGLDIKRAALPAARVFDNVFGSALGRVSVNDNGAGNIAIDGKLAPSPFVPDATGLDSNGNQHGLQGSGPTAGPKPIPRPDKPR